MDKRIELMKMITNADTEGINKIHKKLFMPNDKTKSNLTIEKFCDLSAETFSDMAAEDPALILLHDIFGKFTAKFAVKVFSIKEED